MRWPHGKHSGSRIRPILLHPVALAATALLSTSLGGCISLPRAAFTEAQEKAAAPLGFSGVRYAENDPKLALMLTDTLKPGPRGVINALAISGGGANGAYGAGLLVQWSKTGSRPTFQMVTGVSTGALAAPFAFLGPAWDETLQRAYLDPRLNHILKSRGLRGLLTPGFFSGEPLRRIVNSYVTDDVIQAVAAEHAKGRRLLVATTNLDAQEMIVWDMGAIAAKGGPTARELFATVLIASASVPGAFPPTMIKVQSDGAAFSEMHVDGQAESAFFAIPQTALLATSLSTKTYNARLFIIINGNIDSEFAVTPRGVLPILKRTMAASTKSSVKSVLITAAEFCKQNGCDLEVSSLPSSVKDASLDFHPQHLQDLFTAGEAAGADPASWKTPAKDAPKSATDAVPPKHP